MAQAARILKTKVGIIGGGPAGLMLSHLLSKSGIENIVVEMRDHETIRNTHRAGILEAQAVAMLTDSGVDGRVLTHGDEHAGIDLRFNGESHPLDFRDLVDATVTLYAQNEVFVDLAAARARDNGDVRFNCEVTEILDMETSTPKFRFTDAEGVEFEVHADVIVGADGSRSFARRQMPDSVKQDFKVTYPFAWFGILTEAPKSSRS